MTEASQDRNPPCGGEAAPSDPDALRQAPTSWRVRRRILVPLALVILGLIGGFGALLYNLVKRDIETDGKKVLRAVPATFQAELDREANLMAATLGAVARDDATRSAFQTGDTDALLAWAKPLLKELREQYRVTHFYFLGPDRVCLLRVHQPGRRGDRIDRFTAREAEKTGRVAHGIELGPLGTFTLRVVRPWYADGRLIGYLELGEEIEHVTEHLRESLGVELCVAIHKEYLDRAAWQEGMTMLGRQADWDRFPSSVVVSRTLEPLPDGLGRYLTKGEHHYGPAEVEVPVDGRDYSVAFHELKDAGGREVGDMVILLDVTADHAALGEAMAGGALLCLALGGGLFAFFFIFLGRADTTLARQSLGLIAANKKLQTVIDAIPDTLLAIDRDHRIVMANRAARRLAGGDDPAATGCRCHAFSHKRDTPCEGQNAPCPLPQVYRTKAPVTVEHTHYDRDGKGRHVEVTAAPVFDESGEVVQVIETCRDITDRKRAEEGLQRSNAELEQFAYVASHDLQEPLRMVTGYVKMLERRYKGRLDDDADDFIHFAADGAQRMAVLINDLLQYSRVTTRGKELAATDCEAVLEAVLANLEVAIVETGAQVTHDPLPTVLADEVQLGRLLQNLIGNAIKYHGEAPPQIHVSAERTNGQWRFAVRDNGIGIASEHTERIFTIFQRLHGRDEYEGTGIGLAISKRIVERHGGRIWVESEPGVGSTFHFTIAAASVPNPDDADAPAPEAFVLAH